MLSAFLRLRAHGSRQPLSPSSKALRTLPARKAGTLAAMCVAVTGLSGCAMQTLSDATSVATPAITGTVHGGQQVITGAHVYVMEAGTGGYGTAATSRLTIGDGTDTIGTYVLTGVGGEFSLTGKYTCTANSQDYILVEGGNPGLANGTYNSSAALIGVLGNCPGTTFAASIPHVTINELTTVAAVYALSGFMSSATSVANSGTALSNTGMANAFATAGNLVNIATGQTTPTSGNNGTLPLATINTLGNIISACVNTTGTVLSASQNGGVATNCYSLFHDAVAASPYPTDTVAALLAVAKSPAKQFDAAGGFSTNDLFNLSTAIAPFQPSLTTAPNDFLLEVSYTGGGLSGTLTNWRTVAVDASGNVWTVSPSSLNEFSPLGAAISGTSGFANQNPFGSNVALAIDPSGYVWTVSPTSSGFNATLNIYSPSGAAATGSPIAVSGSPSDVAFDGSGNAFGVDTYNSALQIVTVPVTHTAGVFTGATVTTKTGNSLSSPRGVAVQPGAAGNVFVANGSGGVASVFTDAGVIVGAYSLGQTGSFNAVAIDASGNAWYPNISNGGNNTNGTTKLSAAGAASGPYNNPNFITHASSPAIDGLGNVWVAPASIPGTQQPMYVLSNAGANLSGFNGLVQDVTPTSLAIDGSGNVWFRNATDATLRELIGAAAPVVTPVAAGTAASKLGTRP